MDKNDPKSVRLVWMKMMGFPEDEIQEQLVFNPPTDLAEELEKYDAAYRLNTKSYGYMDKVDFEEELGEALGGNKIFPSVEDLLKNKPCSNKCGIVKVQVSLVEVIQEAKRMTLEEIEDARQRYKKRKEQ